MSETKEYMYKYYRIIEFMSEFIEKIDNWYLRKGNRYGVNIRKC